MKPEYQIEGLGGNCEGLVKRVCGREYVLTDLDSQLPIVGQQAYLGLRVTGKDKEILRVITFRG